MWHVKDRIRVNLIDVKVTVSGMSSRNFFDACCDSMSISPKSRCSWPSIITVVTRDQYGEVVHVPNMRVEVKAVPVDEMNSAAAAAATTSSGSKVVLCQILKIRNRFTLPFSKMRNCESKIDSFFLFI